MRFMVDRSILVNYNDITATEPWNDGERKGYMTIPK
jgi:hypothetical protein